MLTSRSSMSALTGVFCAMAARSAGVLAPSMRAFSCPFCCTWPVGRTADGGCEESWGTLRQVVRARRRGERRARAWHTPERGTQRASGGGSCGEERGLRAVCALAVRRHRSSE